jgi:hypothetical protein
MQTAIFIPAEVKRAENSIPRLYQFGILTIYPWKNCKFRRSDPPGMLLWTVLSCNAIDTSPRNKLKKLLMLETELDILLSFNRRSFDLTVLTIRLGVLMVNWLHVAKALLLQGNTEIAIPRSALIWRLTNFHFFEGEKSAAKFLENVAAELKIKKKKS